jgi:hypothetical protein
MNHLQTHSVPQLEPSMHAALEAYLGRPVRGRLDYDDKGCFFLTTEDEEVPLELDERT